MTPDHARKMHLSSILLHSYLAADGSRPPPADEELADLADGNLLLADTVVGMLAQLRSSTFDHVLDTVPERDERYPDDEASTPMWATTVDMLKLVHASGWQKQPEISSVYDVHTAFRSSFNLAGAATFELAQLIRQSPIAAAKMMIDMAAQEMS